MMDLTISSGLGPVGALGVGDATVDPFGPEIVAAVGGGMKGSFQEHGCDRARAGTTGGTTILTQRRQPRGGRSIRTVATPA
jgi:hypothetical protein